MLSTILMGREPYSRADIYATVDRLKKSLPKTYESKIFGE